MSADPLDELIERLNKGDMSAAERAFVAYEPYLRMAVRRRLSGALRTKLDSMDIVQSVWADVLSGSWRCGLAIRRPVPLSRLPGEGGAQPVDRSPPPASSRDREGAAAGRDGAEEMPKAHDPRPSEIAQGNELWKRMLEQCSPAHREILVLKRQGLLLTEIAARTGLHEGSIRRILYDLARRLAMPRRTATAVPAAIRPED